MLSYKIIDFRSEWKKEMLLINPGQYLGLFSLYREEGECELVSQAMTPAIF